MTNTKTGKINSEENARTLQLCLFSKENDQPLCEFSCRIAKGEMLVSLTNIPCEKNYRSIILPLDRREGSEVMKLITRVAENLEILIPKVQKVFDNESKDFNFWFGY